MSALADGMMIILSEDPTPVVQTHLRRRTRVLRQLGDVLGPLHYMGTCPCGSQHMSTSALVGCTEDGATLCEACARKVGYTR